MSTAILDARTSELDVIQEKRASAETLKLILESDQWERMPVVTGQAPSPTGRFYVPSITKRSAAEVEGLAAAPVNEALEQRSVRLAAMPEREIRAAAFKAALRTPNGDGEIADLLPNEAGRDVVRLSQAIAGNDQRELAAVRTDLTVLADRNQVENQRQAILALAAVGSPDAVGGLRESMAHSRLAVASTEREDLLGERFGQVKRQIPEDVSFRETARAAMWQREQVERAIDKPVRFVPPPPPDRTVSARTRDLLRDAEPTS